jgi:hypothetical protein
LKPPEHVHHASSHLLDEIGRGAAGIDHRRRRHGRCISSGAPHRAEFVSEEEARAAIERGEQIAITAPLTTSAGRFSLLRPLGVLAVVAMQVREQEHQR